jgi:DNA polymerase III subunit epsilon
MITRQIVLDTETTGFDPKKGHRLIEIGCVELINRRLTGHHFHYYFNPDREIDAGALAVHGITNEFLRDKPRFKDKVSEMFSYLEGAELIIHNAPFDLGFLQSELELTGNSHPNMAETYSVVDTLLMARQLHPGQKNNLDALCKRYHIDNSQRALHGALLDAEILAQVYLAMTGGQTSLFTGDAPTHTEHAERAVLKQLGEQKSYQLKVIKAREDERQAHLAMLKIIAGSSADGQCVWETASEKT